MCPTDPSNVTFSNVAPSRRLIMQLSFEVMLFYISICLLELLLQSYHRTLAVSCGDKTYFSSGRHSHRGCGGYTIWLLKGVFWCTLCQLMASLCKWKVILLSAMTEVATNDTCVLCLVWLARIVVDAVIVASQCFTANLCIK